MRIKQTLLTVAVIIFFTPLFSHSAGVSGHYASASGKTIALVLSIASPAPQSIIVEQVVSPSNSIKGGSPQPKKINQKNGQVKWLLTNIHPGKIQIRLSLGAPLKGSVSATIRYRNPGNGQFTEFSVSP